MTSWKFVWLVASLACFVVSVAILSIGTGGMAARLAFIGLPFSGLATAIFVYELFNPLVEPPPEPTPESTVDALSGAVDFVHKRNSESS